MDALHNVVRAVCFVFEVHQPIRIRPDPDVWIRAKKAEKWEDLLEIYFDQYVNQLVIERAARKCYLPATRIILENVRRYEGRFKVAFSLSGVFVEQCKRWAPEVLDLIKRVVDAGGAELLCQTYFHSIASLWDPRGREFVEQVKMHQELIKEEFGYRPQVFENTEFLFNDLVAETVERLGFKAIFTEGAEWRIPEDPCYVYQRRGGELRVLLRHYRLSDDIGFRYSSWWWEEYPLLPAKWARWVAVTPGDVVNICLDYETFGEHHWPETGIHNFLQQLPHQLVEIEKLDILTPSEVIERFPVRGEVGYGPGFVSWADMERDESAWLGTSLQRKCLRRLLAVEPFAREAKGWALHIWRYLTTSDHFYYMAVRGGGPGVVHDYFSHLKSPERTAHAYLTILEDLERRIRSGFGSEFA